MTELKMNEVVMALAKALQSRDYDSFVSYFSDNAVFEIPFSVNGGTVINGLSEIKKHFDTVSQNPITKLISVEDVTPRLIYGTTGNSVVVEYFLKGKSLKTGEAFNIQSSIAVIRFDEGKIIEYRDFPNTLGIAKKAGVLAELAATWVK